MPNHSRIAYASPALLTVQAPEDIEFLIKESEIITGRPGRTFAVAGANWQVFRLHWLQGVVKVDRLDVSGQVLSTERVPTKAFCEHRLIGALASGLLFTPPVGCPN